MQCILYYIKTRLFTLVSQTHALQHWSAHHKLKELNSLPGEVRIAWLICDNVQFLDEQELLMIAHFKPWMNGSKVKQPTKDGHLVNTDKDRVTVVIRFLYEVELNSAPCSPTPLLKASGGRVQAGGNY